MIKQTYKGNRNIHTYMQCVADRKRKARMSETKNSKQKEERNSYICPRYRRKPFYFSSMNSARHRTEESHVQHTVLRPVNYKLSFTRIIYIDIYTHN